MRFRQIEISKHTVIDKTLRNKSPVIFKLFMIQGPSQNV